MNYQRQKYIQLCHEEKIPLFSQYYWLDSVCGAENWDVILIEENGNILASLPYFLNKTEEGDEIRKAPLTQNNGVFLFYPPRMKYDRKLAFGHRVVDQVIDKIEQLNLCRYRQYFHYRFENWLPFYWRGYSQSTRYTYVIEDTSSLKRVKENFNGNVRKQLRKAEKIVQVTDDLDYEQFYRLNRKTFERQGLDIPYDFELFQRLYKCLEKKSSVKIVAAIDRHDNVHSAALYVYDHTSVYYLMSGSVEKYRNFQSLTLLIYEGIKLAYKLGRKFDFEGSMKKNIESFFRQFGAIQKPYFDIRKDSTKP